MALWSGRFSKEIDKQLNDFNSSISFDCRMYRQDIKGSMAHAAMLKEQGIISKEDNEKIQKGLAGILEDLENGRLDFDPNAEDIHMFIEEELTKRIGDSGKRLHTARSRNDQVALDTKLYFHDEIGAVLKLCRDLINMFLNKAEENVDTIMPGYTHLQRGQPTTLAHYLVAYAQMFLRDIQRLKDCDERILNAMPLGSGAGFGTTYPVDRKITADILGFRDISVNSIDGVSDRDFAVELASCLSILMMHLSRVCEEVILWCSWVFKFLELDDAFSTGSSIMPQKKNPDIAELIRGKTARVYGDLVTLLTMMKGLPLAYDKDMQEDKQALFDAVDTVKLCVPIFIPMFETSKVLKENMREAAAKGFINATDLADYLTKKGMPFRDAHRISGQLVAYCISKNTVLEKLDLETLKSYSPLFERDVYRAISLETCVKERNSAGGPAPQEVKRQIAVSRETMSRLMSENRL